MHPGAILVRACESFFSSLACCDAHMINMDTGRRLVQPLNFLKMGFARLQWLFFCFIAPKHKVALTHVTAVMLALGLRLSTLLEVVLNKVLVRCLVAGTILPVGELSSARFLRPF